MQDVSESITLQKQLMNLNPDVLSDVASSIGSSKWVQGAADQVMLAHYLCLTALYRPYSTSLAAQLIKLLDNESLNATLVKNVCNKMISRAYTPTRSGLGSFLFWCVREGVFGVNFIISQLQEFESSSSNFDVIAFNLFVWLAPELESDAPDFFAKCMKIIAKMSAVEGHYPTVQRFLFDLEKLRNDSWTQLKQRRESSKSLRIFSAIFKRNDIENLLQLSVHPAFNIDQNIAQSIFEPAFFVSNSPTMIEFAAYCGAVDCFAFLLENGADVFGTDKDGLCLRDFAIAGGCEEAIEVCREFDEDFDQSAHVFAQFYYPNITISAKTLFAATKAGNIEAVVKCIDGKIDVNVKDSKNRTPLMIACEFQHIEILKLLLSQPNIDINAQDCDGFTALQRACQNGCIEVLELMLAVPGIDVMQAQRYGMTPFHWVCQKGFVECAKRLLSDARVDPAAKDDEQWSPVHFAAQAGHSAVLELLLLHDKVDVNAQQQDGMAPIHFAASNGDQRIIDKLMKCASVNMGLKDHSGFTCVHWAAQHGHSEILEVLLNDDRVDPNEQDNDLWTAFFWAAQNDHVEAVKALLSCDRVNPNITEKDGMIPLHVAAMNGAAGVCQIMLECKNVNHDQPDNSGKTPLHLACRSGNTEIVEMFVAHPNVNINTQQKNGMTPMHFAVSNGNDEVVSVLLKHPEINLDIKDEDGSTPMDFAKTFRYESIEALLTK